MRAGSLGAVLRGARRGLVGDAVAYSAGNAGAAVLPLLMLPILTRNLSTAEYGLYANVLACVALLVPFANLGLSNVVARDYVHRDDLDYPRVVTTSVAISAACALLMGCLGLGIALAAPSLLAEWLGGNPVPIVVAALLMLFGQTLLPTLLAIFSMQRRVLLYVAVRISYAALFAIAAVTAVLGLNSGGEGVVIVKAATDLALLGFGCWWLARERLLVSRVSGAEARRCLAYALPLVPQMAAAAAIGAIDRLIIAHVLGTGPAGVYSVGHQIGMVMWLVVNSCVQAWQPWFYQRMKEGTAAARRNIIRKSYLLVAGWILLAVAFGAGAPFVVDVIAGDAYREARAITPWIIAAFLFQGLYSLASAYLYYSGQTGRLALAAVAATAAQTVLTFALTSINGIVGAAQAVAGAYLLLFVLVVLAARSTARAPWPDAATAGRDST